MKNKIKIRMLTAFLTAVILSAAFHLPLQACGLRAGRAYPAAVSAASKNGILSESGKKYCYVKGKRKTGLVRSGKNWYYFGPEMKYGLIRAGNTVYYADRKGVLQTGFRTIEGRRYYFNANTRKFEGHEGLLNVNAKYYICVKGLIRFGSISYGGKEYFAGPDGLLKTGWQNVNGNWSYFWPGAGDGHARFQKASGTVVIGGVTHYLGPDGIPLKTYEGRALDRYGAATEIPAPAPQASSGPAETVPSAPSPLPAPADAGFFGDVSAGRTPAQKAILSCLNYYESRLQKLNADNQFEESCRKKDQASRNVWQYSNKSPLTAYFMPFDKIDGGAFTYRGKTVRCCNCDSCKWWVVKDLLHTNAATSSNMHTVWKKYTVKGLKFRDIFKQGGFTVRQNGKEVRVNLVPGTCFYDVLPGGRSNHTWIYMGPDRSGTERIFDTGHGGVHSDPAKTDRVRSWERDLTGRFHTDGSRAIFRTWVNEITDTRDYEDKTVGTIWVPNDLKSFYYRNSVGKLVKN